jgi:hypothetical protein
VNPRLAWVEPHAAALAALLTLVAGLLTMTGEVVFFFDDAVYLLVAKAIASGQGFVYPHLPGTPAAIHYPPLFPLILSGIWRVLPEFPANLVWFKLVNPVLLAGVAAGGVVVAREHFGARPLVAVIVVLAATVSVPVHVLTTVVLSEPLFLALLFPALLATDRARTGNGRWVVAAALLAAALVLTRTIGGVLVVATLLVMAQDRRWRAAALYATVVALALLPWQLFVWRHAPGFVPELRGSYGPYLEWLVEGYREGGVALFAAVVSKNAADAWHSVGVTLSPSTAAPVRAVAAFLGVSVLAWGALVGARRGVTQVAALALAGYLALVLIWPYQVERFIWGVWPLILMVAYDGARDLWTRAAAPRALGLAVILLAAFVVIGHTRYSVRGFARGWESSAPRGMGQRVLPIIQYVQADPRLAGVVISSEGSPLVALYTGRQVIPVEILAVRDHVRSKSRAERAEVIAAIDRRFRPDAYVLTVRGPYLPAVLETSFDPGRRFLEISPPDLPVRAFRALP